ncbi:MAG: signal peptidase I [Planctomycetes bacterium]|nr:signal peptidase I [Planctomycetota bacterium]
MISQTARPHILAGGRQRSWTQWAGRLARLLVIIGTLALLGTLLAAAVVPRLWGYQSYVIYGSSMEPTIKLGSLILAKPVEADDLQVGDIIVFRGGNETTVTHRITGIREEDGHRFFLTKGDASNGSDPLETHLEGGVHRLAYHVPYLGYFVDFAKSTPGIILLVALPALGLLALHLTNSRERAGKDREAAGEA